MTRAIIRLASCLCLTCAGVALAEERAPVPPPEQSIVCPPGSQEQRQSGERLRNSNGIICAPPDVDPKSEMKPPSEGGALKIIPPPGSPGGDPDVQPK